MIKFIGRGSQPQGPITITTKATNISIRGSTLTLQFVLVQAHRDVKVQSLQRMPFQAVIIASKPIGTLERKRYCKSLLAKGNLTIYATTGQKRSIGIESALPKPTVLLLGQLTKYLSSVC